MHLINKYIRTFVFLGLAFLFSMGIQYLFAWTGPTQPAPNGNTPEPINVGNNIQVKNGPLGVDNLAVYGQSYYQDDATFARRLHVAEICLNGTCLTSWGGSGTVLAECEDLVDNDSDGLTDMNDPGCSSSSDDDEYNAPPVNTSAPSAPQNLTATGGDGFADMAWSAPASNGGASISGYNVWIGTSADSGVVDTADTSASDEDHRFTGLTNDTTYYAKVRARNSVGYGPYSSAVQVTPTAGTQTYALGDVDRSGTVSSYDASLILQYLANTQTLDSEQQALADVTGSGGITVLDAEVLLAYTAQVVSSLPFNPPLGDVTLNGSVSSYDASVIGQHVAGQNPSDFYAESLADVTNDGSITNLDADVVLAYTTGIVRNLPFSPRLGDVTLNNNVSSADGNAIINGNLSLGRQEIADINEDGQVTPLDGRIVLSFANSNQPSSLPASSLIYGDVSMNGSVAAYDATLVQQYVDGTRSLSTLERLVADVNDDGSVNQTDVDVILQYVAGSISSLPSN